MSISPRQSWLTGTALAGMLLAGSVFVPSASQALAVQPQKGPEVLASDYTFSDITLFLNRQSPRNIVGPTATPAAPETKHSSTTKANVQDTTRSPESSSQSINIAAIASRRIEPEIKQASRGTSDSSPIVEYALSLLRTPYVYGGTTRKGFDCSGFTQYVFAQSGISLPRTSYEQYASGAVVSRDKLQPGDLVFFTIYAKGASHVGIYIGGGRFVHADNPQVGVTITSLSNSFYSAHYLGARRYD